MALNQNDTDFFRPLWRRVAITLVVAVWCAYETFFSHEEMWIAITSVALIYCVWNFFLRYPRDPPGTPQGPTGGEPSTGAAAGSDTGRGGAGPPAAPKA